MFSAPKLLRVAILTVVTIGLAPAYARQPSQSPTPAPNHSLLFGRVLAGNRPIRNATVTLFGTVDAGRPRMDSESTYPVAETRTDADGGFSFDVSKAHASWLAWDPRQGTSVRVEHPPRPGTFYLVANGGDAGGGNNPAIALVSAFGTPPVPRHLTINELTTVVAAFSVGSATIGRWPTDNYGKRGSAAFPMAFPSTDRTDPSDRSDDLRVMGDTPSEDSLALTCQLIDPVTGRLQPIFSQGANSPALVNTLADILHACVASKEPGFPECRSLLQAATLPHPWRFLPNDTLTAIESITSKLGRANPALLKLLPSERPYTPVLDQAPSGWLLSLNFQGLDLNRPTAIHAERDGSTLLILNAGSRTLSELRPAPEHFANPSLSARELPAPIRDQPTDFSFALVNESYRRPTGPASWFAKPSIWLADGKLIFLNADGTLCAPPTNDLGLKGARGLSTQPYSDKIFISNTGANELLILGRPVDGCEGVKILARLKPPFPAPIPDSILSSPAQVVTCRSVNVTNAGGNSVSALYPAVCPQALRGAPLRGAGLSDPEGIDCDHSGDVWVANRAGNSVTELEVLQDLPQPLPWISCVNGADRGQYDLGRLDSLSPSSGFSGAGLNQPYGVAVDNLGNVWVTNEGNDSLTVFIGAGGVPSGFRALSGG